MQIPQFPKIVWIMILGSGFSRGTYFMVFSFLALYLKNFFQVDLETIGWVIGIGPIAGIIFGFYGAYLSDFFGRRFILIVSLLCWGFVLAAFSLASEIWHFAALSALSGVFRSVVDPIVQAIVSDNTEGELKDKAFHYRYYAINVGASIGMLAGSWIILNKPVIGFVLAGGALAIFAELYRSTTRTIAHKKLTIEKPPGFIAVMKILLLDRPLKYYVLASILCATAYAQIDTTLPVILNSLFSEEGIRLYGYVVAFNGATIVLTQLWLNKWTKKFSLIGTVVASCFVFALGFVGFSLSGSIKWAYFVSMLVLSVGEVLVFSNGFILIDRLAPKNIKATYHSASNLFTLGLAAGAPLGMWLLMISNTTYLFAGAAFVLLLSGVCYLLGGRSANPV